MSLTIFTTALDFIPEGAYIYPPREDYPTMYTIEKGIPAPPTSAGGGRKYPFNVMEVGDSFGISSKEEAKRVSACAVSFCKLHTGVKLSVQQHGTAWRCWRIA